ncbi:FecR family protein [Dysgonomonas sp. 511]|uniref:FecR family protein n=1 Tax=Dysgonomonas sp. 511 TaxID=2302930 RepID=UPI0013D1E8D0|nr:FecR domain-containing protein [Dysgonomonas sp. 511]NDV77968.1 DUF4974 domain-containing protein [Dysgonomonas sp. 511]
MDNNLLYKFFEGLTSIEEEKAIRSWLDSSPENEKSFFKERQIYDAFILNSKYTDVQYEEFEGDENKTRKNVRFYLKEFVKIAAVVLVTALGMTYYLSQSDDTDTLLAMQTISVPAGQRMNVILPDGTDIWLNAKTTIKYPVSFNSKERRVYLDGQAYFDVAKNEELPFTVETKQGEVTALGTKFDVLAYSDSEVFETTLMDGKVRVGLVGKPEQSLILEPNHKSYIDAHHLASVQVTDFSSYEWRNGLIGFKNETFENIMKSFEKTYDIKIVIQNPKIGRSSFTGKFRVADGVDYALRVLQRELRFKYKRDTEKHIIYIK